MLLLNDAVAFELAHRPTCGLRGVPSQSLFVTASREGHVSLCGLDSEANISCLSVPGTIAAVCPHPTKPLLALIEGARFIEGGAGKLVIRRFDGSLAFEETAPRLPEGSPEWMTAGYADCWFDESGVYLWCAASASKDKVEVQLRETGRWSVVSRDIVEDPFGGSWASFHRTGRPEALALWLAAGQDGQCVYWMTRNGGSLRSAIEPCLKDTVPPAFSLSGHEFLTINELGALQKFQYPTARLLGVCESPYGADDHFGTSLCYLDNTRALVESHNSRVAVLDTPTMCVVDEIVIEDHEPRPVEEYYPTLSGDKQLCTDIAYFERVGDHIIFVYPLHHPMDPRPDGRLRLDEWKDGLLCFRVSYVLDQLR